MTLLALEICSLSSDNIYGPYARDRHGLAWKVTLPATKGQLISKGLFKVFISPKNEQKYFCISALASKKSSNQKSNIRESK